MKDINYINGHTISHCKQVQILKGASISDPNNEEKYNQNSHTYNLLDLVDIHFSADPTAIHCWIRLFFKKKKEEKNAL